MSKSKVKKNIPDYPVWLPEKLRAEAKNTVKISEQHSCGAGEIGKPFQSSKEKAAGCNNKIKKRSLKNSLIKLNGMPCLIVSTGENHAPGHISRRPPKLPIPEIGKPSEWKNNAGKNGNMIQIMPESFSVNKVDSQNKTQKSAVERHSSAIQLNNF
jgi:hypothetical protein